MTSDAVVDLIFKLQAVWAGIHGRCNSPKHRSWKDYGAKGITLCSEWSGRSGSVNFVKWAIINGYKYGLDIDRIDNTKGYSPTNCRFVSRQVNCWNKSNNLLLTFQDETKCSAEWGADPRCVVPSNQFQQRIKCDWPIDRALFTPLRTHPTQED